MDELMVVDVHVGLEEEMYDEEANERDSFHIERLVEEFANNEEYVLHDEIPSSDDEEEEVVREREYRNLRRGDGTLYMEQRFFNGVAFKECVLDNALKTGRNLKQYRYDKEKIGFKCVGSDGREGYKGCDWQVYASILPKDSMWKIRKFIDKHTCIPNGECEMLKVPQIARLFVDKLRNEPDYFLPKKIEQIIKETYKISVTRHQSQSARLKALKWIETKYDEQFSRLRDYAAEILVANPETIVEVDTIKNDEGNDVFNKFYVCFDPLRKTWKDSCRPLIGVDGCFLKHKIKGQLLVALGRDVDNGIYPIAWSVVQVENKDNWLWFVRRLKIDLELNDGDGYIITSDRQKGLILAVEAELPKVEHRMCVRHIYGNLKKKHPGKKPMKSLMWRLAWSYNETEYKERLDRIFQYDVSVYNDIVRANPKSWTRAFYKLGPYCEDVDNNFTESFNNTINKAREKPFVAMLETVRRLAMARISNRSVKSINHKGLCTPYVARFLEKEHKQAANCIVIRGTNQRYEVTLGGDYHRVCLQKRTCSCIKFQICGIPCEHAYGVIIEKNLLAEDYVCSWFRTDMWKRNYIYGIRPQRGPRFWPLTDSEAVHAPPESPTKKKMTKADKKRKKGLNESPIKKTPMEKKRIMHCKVCGQANHNSKRHKNDNAQASHGHASQGQEQASLGHGQASQGQEQASQGHGQASQGQASQGQASQG